VVRSPFAAVSFRSCSSAGLVTAVFALLHMAGDVGCDSMINSDSVTRRCGFGWRKWKDVVAP
jgi:hypothetical protein